MDYVNYPLELPLHFSRPMKNLIIKRCRNYNWIKIQTLVVVVKAADKGIASIED